MWTIIWFHHRLVAIEHGQNKNNNNAATVASTVTAVNKSSNNEKNSHRVHCSMQNAKRERENERPTEASGLQLSNNDVSCVCDSNMVGKRQTLLFLWVEAVTFVVVAAYFNSLLHFALFHTDRSSGSSVLDSLDMNVVFGRTSPKSKQIR